MSEHKVRYLTNPKPFEEKYLKVREIEGRVLSDDEVRKLPEFRGTPRLIAEWKMRQRTYHRFLKYLGQRSFSSCLDIGCGNGWFTYGVSQKISGQVVGLDVNAEELEQANRVFQSAGLEFSYGDLFQDIFPGQSFELIVLNASIQYFPDLAALFRRLNELLAENGEIHVLDSPFYPEDQVAAAKERSLAYYTSVGYPEMADEYYHHSLGSLSQYQPETMYRPKRINRLLGKADSPFTWYRIKR